MPKTTTFRIRYRPDGKWQGTMEGDAEPMAVADTRDVVKEAVFKSARERGHSRVLVFDGSGTEVEERTFGEPRVKGYAGNWD